MGLESTPTTPPTTPPEAPHDPAPVAVQAQLVRSWRGAPTRPTDDGGAERYCRVCRQWHPVAAFRPYVASGCANTLCRTCERTARRLRYLRDHELEKTRARNWSRNQRAALKAATIEPVATGSQEEDATHETTGAAM